MTRWWPALLTATPLLAQAPDPRAAQPERPTVATHAGTVAPGYLEIESGGEYDRFKDRSHGVVAPTLFKFGVAPRLQLSVMVPVVSPQGAGAGLGDAGVGLKWRFREGGGLLGDLAILPSIKFPSGSDALGRGTGTTDAGLMFIASHQLGPVALDLNAGITRRSGNGSVAPRTATVWCVSFGGPASGPVGWVAELYGYPKTTGPAGSDAIVAILAGPTVQLDYRLVLDVGGIIPVRGPQPHAVYVGITWNAGRL